MQDFVANTDLCALLDGECSPSERQRVEATLARSPQCAQRLSAWRRNDAALRFAIAAGLSDHTGRSSATPVIQALAHPPVRDDAPLRMDAAPLRARPAHSVRAAIVAAFAGGSGVAALAFAVLMLAGR